MKKITFAAVLTLILFSMLHARNYSPTVTIEKQLANGQKWFLLVMNYSKTKMELFQGVVKLNNQINSLNEKYVQLRRQCEIARNNADGASVDNILPKLKEILALSKKGREMAHSAIYNQINLEKPIVEKTYTQPKVKISLPTGDYIFYVSESKQNGMIIASRMLKYTVKTSTTVKIP